MTNRAYAKNNGDGLLCSCIVCLKFINDRGRVTMVHGWTSSLISKICLFARSGISKISIVKSIYLENHVSHNEL
jgi:hypothetical protein